MRVTRNVVVMLVGIMLATLFTTAPAGAIVIKPTATGFVSSTTTLYKTGGTITLSATVANAATCVFTSNKVIAGMPFVATPCNGLVTHDVSLPVNAGKHAAVYSFKLLATGARTTYAKPGVKVTVSTQLPPPSQTAPTLGTVVTTGSAAFTDQLNASGGYGAVTFATTVPNSGLSVSSTGAVSTTGALAAGDYTASGTVTDALLAGGTWTYTLTVNEEPISGAIAIAAGRFHSCALMAGGTVKCWGYNYYGELGNGYSHPYGYSGPVTVFGLTGATAIAVGTYHTCALISDGTVKCWGYNGYGELGTRSTTDSLVPVNVYGLTGVISISTGQYHTCALMSGGTGACWGYNGNGGLGGGGNYAYALSPVSVIGLGDGIAISAATLYTCALISDGTVKCWGSVPSFGSTVAVTVNGLTGVRGIAAGENHTCALLSGGTVQCWGANDYGQLGNGTITTSSVPVAVNGLNGVSAISAGLDHTCALRPSGTGACWGSNGYGELGIGSTTQSNTPNSISGLSGATAIAAGFHHTCALLSGGTVQCWGANDYGQLGDENTTNSSIPVSVVGL